ncbi:MAG: hypothetical protein RL369_1239, partial [Pseudomonadota bacterium]
MVTVNALMKLKGRRALITGAGGGLGRIMTQTLAELGADLVLLDRSDTSLASLADETKITWDVDV